MYPIAATAEDPAIKMARLPSFSEVTATPRVVTKVTV